MQIGIHFGALADPIVDQLKQQGIELDAADIEVFKFFQEDAKSLTRVYIRGLFPQSAVENARRKLMKKIIKYLNQKVKP